MPALPTSRVFYLKAYLHPQIIKRPSVIKRADTSVLEYVGFTVKGGGGIGGVGAGVKNVVSAQCERGFGVELIA